MHARAHECMQANHLGWSWMWRSWRPQACGSFHRCGVPLLSRCSLLTCPPAGHCHKRELEAACIAERPACKCSVGSMPHPYKSYKPYMHARLFVHVIRNPIHGGSGLCFAFGLSELAV